MRNDKKLEIKTGLIGCKHWQVETSSEFIGYPV